MLMNGIAILSLRATTAVTPRCLWRVTRGTTPACRPVEEKHIVVITFVDEQSADPNAGRLKRVSFQND